MNRPAIIAGRGALRLNIPTAAWLAAGLILASSAPSGGREPILHPLWVWAPADGLVWAQSVEDIRPTLIFAATGSGQLSLIEPGSGRALLSRPIQAHPGVRAAEPCLLSAPSEPPAGSNPTTQTPLLCAYDRFCVYAVTCGPSARLAWQAGYWPEDMTPGADSRAAFQGDPEMRPRLLTAAATPDGVLVVRDDGQVALLAPESGRVVWEKRLPRLANARLHVRDHDALLLYQAGSRVAAARIKLPGKRWDPLRLPDGENWPTWSAWAPEGVVLVSPDRVTLVTPEGTGTWQGDGRGNTILAATVTLVSRRSRGEGTGSLLVFGTLDGNLQALELATGRTTWRVRDADPGAGWRCVRVFGESVVSVTGNRLTRRRLGNGLGNTCDLPPNRELTDFAFLGATIGILHRAADGPTDWRLTLWLPETAPASRLRCFSLPEKGESLACFAQAGHLILATKQSLSGYRIPSLEAGQFETTQPSVGSCRPVGGPHR